MLIVIYCCSPRTLSPVSVNVRLSNGRIMPRLAFGTWQLPLPDCELTVLTAIRQGYRHIDTAEAFRNEFCVGWAVIHAIKEGKTGNAYEPVHSLRLK